MAYHSSDQSAPARSWKSVTPSDSVNLPAGCRGLFLGGTVVRDISLVGDDNVAVVFADVPGGSFLPVGPVRVNATGTTVLTDIVALY